MKFQKLAVFTFAVTMAATSVMAADFGVRGGIYKDTDEPFVGVEAVFGLGSNFAFNPNIEYVLTDVEGFDLMTINGDVTYNFAPRGTVQPWVGAGAALGYTRSDCCGDDTEPGFNLLAGVGFRLGTLQPYVQAKYVRFLEDEAGDDLVGAVGFRF